MIPICFPTIRLFIEQLTVLHGRLLMKENIEILIYNGVVSTCENNDYYG